ncbi:signal peptide peptidase SppA [Pseudopontixanthobacter vadosimaris]|uniref:signal peptide peptidase SppA n=1 Tax=Pseudopontixanthobacter vadosimaris TaxID=2726450 RepID=UPI001474548E|nr:signal peptide peptidase SppA [Pseudopontixanthobacter vadosimaris]
MIFARKVWHLLVGIKDGLSLIFLLLFFALLYAVLTARPSPAMVKEGALLLELDGIVVEERTEIDPFALLLSGAAPTGEYPVRELVRALDAAADDERIGSVVLDLTRFMGGGQVHLQEIGGALDRVRAAEKPVLTYAVAYADDGMMLAAHASEVWLDPMGGASITGPGGNRLYYGELLDRLNVNARVYKVGEYKSAVEPYLRSDMSDAARENYEALYGALWEEWQANVLKARPGTDIARVTQNPAEWLQANGGDFATAALRAGLVDKLGNRAQFGARVAEISGEDEWSELPGAFAHTELDPWLADNPLEETGDRIGVVTVAGTIVDGDAGPGTAGGDRISRILDEALDEELQGLVIRVDSPGGSALASEEIRRAVLRHKARGIPVAVSMANVAASGGYWVATPADRIFAEPESITGSIGIFAVIPTFEEAASSIGVSSDGVKTTVLSGQPDLIAGFPPEVDAILQSTIEDGYNDFIARVSQSRGLSARAVDRIGQGRVWDGGTARQIGLVDQYGGLDDALAWVAAKAGLTGDDWHPVFLGAEEGTYDALLRTMFMPAEVRGPAIDSFALLAGRQDVLIARLQSDLERLTGTRGMQAYCLECPAPRRAATPGRLEGGWLQLLARMLS